MAPWYSMTDWSPQVIESCAHTLTHISHDSKSHDPEPVEHTPDTQAVAADACTDKMHLENYTCLHIHENVSKNDVACRNITTHPRPCLSISVRTCCTSYTT